MLDVELVDVPVDPVIEVLADPSCLSDHLAPLGPTLEMTASKYPT